MSLVSVEHFGHWVGPAPVLGSWNLVLPRDVDFGKSVNHAGNYMLDFYSYIFEISPCIPNTSYHLSLFNTPLDTVTNDA